MKNDPGVDEFLAGCRTWQDEFRTLRTILFRFDLDERLKWGVPCYALQESNIVLMHGFKHYCALLFFKGALLNDTHGILIRQTENVQAARQIRFTGAHQIAAMEPILEEYIRQAIGVEQAGLKLARKTTDEFVMAEEFRSKLDALPALRTAFERLTPGRQRAYLLHFSAAKQSTTRLSRIEKCIPQILDGKGLNDDRP